MKHALISKTIVGLIESAVRSVADRLFILTTGRSGSSKYKPTISTIYETGLVTAIYEFLLMSPDLAHLEIRHEMPYGKKTRPQQVDLWIRPPKGGYANLIECGDFSPTKLKNDASKMRKLNRYGVNWFLAFFRHEPDSKAVWDKLQQSRRRKNGLKGLHIGLDKRLTKQFEIKLPNEVISFGFALIRIEKGSRAIV